MRLLRLDGDSSDGKWRLINFFGKDLPFYAVLSHTWGADEDEVIFEYIEAGNVRYDDTSKAGFDKLRFCYEQAERDGLRYFWIDTCCIKKSNTTELMESINSMFRWYQNSAKCYVYLPDVTAGGPPGPRNYTWEYDFRISRWFTRGWTLQELIAPPSVVFFSKDNHRLGDKAQLEETIREITGLPINAIRGPTHTPLCLFPVKERRQWIKGRQTKKEEDQAYCLQGIMEVQLSSFMYGLGGRKAMRALDEQIERALNEPLEGNFCNYATMGGASWTELIKLDEKQLQSLDTELIHLKDWLFTQSDTGFFNNNKLRNISTEAGAKMKEIFSRFNVPYSDLSLLGAQDHTDAWHRYQNKAETEDMRVLGFVTNRLYWANKGEYMYTGVTAGWTLLTYMKWRGIWKA